MWTSRTSGFLSLIGLLLARPNPLTANVSSRLSVSDSPSAGQEGQRPLVVKRSMQSCSSSFQNYCLNQGQCFYLVDIQQHHCKCERGYYGPRCAAPELVIQPMAEEQVIVIVFCVGLLVLGLSGGLYFCCKWYQKNRFLGQQKRLGYKGVQTA